MIEPERLPLTREEIEPIDVRALDKVEIVLRSILEQRELPNTMKEGRRVRVNQA